MSRTKIEEVTLDALRTRQSLVKGERLVRHEVRAVLPEIRTYYIRHSSLKPHVGRQRLHAGKIKHAIRARSAQLLGRCDLHFDDVTQKGLPHSAVVRCQRRQADWAEASFGNQPPNEK